MFINRGLLGDSTLSSSYSETGSKIQYVGNKKEQNGYMYICVLRMDTHSSGKMGVGVEENLAFHGPTFCAV